MSSARRLSAGSSGVLDGSSLRALPRSQPPCTNVSLPSGLTSLIVAWKSTFGLFVRTNSFTLPAPITVVFELSGAVTYETALPAGFCVQLYGGVAVQRPLVPPAVSPVKSVSGRLKAFPVNASASRLRRRGVVERAVRAEVPLLHGRPGDRELRERL